MVGGCRLVACACLHEIMVADSADFAPAMCFVQAVDDSLLRQLFEPFGTVLHTAVPYDAATSASPCSGPRQRAKGV